MPAVVGIFCDKGGVDQAPGSSFDVNANGGIKFRTDDNPDDLSDSNPVLIGSIAAWSMHSFWVHLYLKVVGGTFGSILKVHFYTEGGDLFGVPGITLRVSSTLHQKSSASSNGYGVNRVPHENYGDPGSPGAVEGVSGNALNSGFAEKDHPYSLGVSNANAFTETNPKGTGAISELGGVIQNVNQMSNYIVLQVRSNTVGGPQQGVTQPAVLTFRWEET